MVENQNYLVGNGKQSRLGVKYFNNATVTFINDLFTARVQFLAWPLEAAYSLSNYRSFRSAEANDQYSSISDSLHQGTIILSHRLQCDWNWEKTVGSLKLGTRYLRYFETNRLKANSLMMQQRSIIRGVLLVFIAVKHTLMNSCKWIPAIMNFTHFLAETCK